MNIDNENIIECQEKFCKKCNKSKAHEEFYKYPDNKDGLSYACKVCSREGAVKSYHLDPSDKKYQKYKQNRLELFNKGLKKCGYCGRAKEFICFNKRARSRDGFAHTCKMCCKRYDLEHKKERNERQSNRKKIDVNFRMKTMVSAALSGALGHRKNKKSNSCVKLLGCSIEYFKDYLKSKLKKGMSFYTNNGWHIDHIIPCEIFDLTDYKQQAVCFHFSNMQPLWEIENRIKSDFIIDGRRARDLSKDEKLEYLKSLGYDFSNPEFNPYNILPFDPLEKYKFQVY